jgi:hypothetical protein
LITTTGGSKTGRPFFNKMKESNKKRNANLSAARQFPTPVAMALLFVLAAGGFWWSKHRQVDVAPVVAPTSQTTNTSVSSEGLSSFEKLKGRWLRTEGSYIIEIRSVEASGKMNAAYFNPRPINVAKAEAMKAGENLGVFVELRDVNYPGSTYTLTYQPATDRLAGTYFHALSGQNMDVEFSRLGEP